MMTKMLFGVACATSSIFYLNDRYKDTPSPFIYDKTKKNTKCLTYLKNHRRNQCPFIYQGYTVESIRTTDTKWSDIPNWSTTFCVFRHLMQHCNFIIWNHFIEDTFFCRKSKNTILLKIDKTSPIFFHKLEGFNDENVMIYHDMLKYLSSQINIDSARSLIDSCFIHCPKMIPKKELKGKREGCMNKM